MITLVITLAATILDDDPILSDSKEDTNLIDSITRDDVDERAQDYIDRDNLLRI